MTGLSLAQYRIDAELGRGGMGIVYRATDTKLDRAVALKVLPPHALSSADDRARFYREAKAAAQLHHPRIATVFQIDEAVLVEDGREPAPDAEKRPFIAMEYVDGETLSERIAKGPMKLQEAVRIATQAAEALGAAHDAGIVHRDVKSGNVMLTSKGEVKVLDFGLAKTAASTQLTRQGATLGTVAYMSPEQARGEEVDARTDLWALGVVLYEMIAGRLPFQADYEQAALYGILNEDPEPLTAVRTGVPMDLEAIAAKLLRKETRQRYQTVADLLADLEVVAHALSPSHPSRSSVSARGLSAVSLPVADREIGRTPGRWRMYALWFGVVGLLAGALITAALMRGDTRSTERPPDIVRSTIMLPDEYPIALAGFRMLGIEMDAIDVSPDGATLAYPALVGDESALVAVDLATGEARVLEGTEGGYNPVFGPDGTWIAYRMETAIFRVRTEGGRPEFVHQVSDATGMHWAEDGALYFADLQGNSLMRLSAEGELSTISANRCNCGMPAEGRPGDLVVVSGRDVERAFAFREDGSIDTLAIAGNHVTFSPDGHVLFTRPGRLMASHWDPTSGQVESEARTVLDDMRTGSILRSGHYAVTAAGTLYYVSGAPSGIVDLVIRERDGSETPVSGPSGVYGPVAVSPDESRILVVDLDRGGQTVMIDLERGTRQALSRTTSAGVFIWNPDGIRVTYAVSAGESWELRQAVPFRPGDGELLLRSDVAVQPSAWSPDGAWFVYERSQSLGRDLVVRRMSDSTDTVISRGENATLWAADVSPDSRLVAYTRVGDGGSSVLVDTLPLSGDPVLIDTGGAEEPEWLPEGGGLVYRKRDGWFAADLAEGDAVAFSAPRELFRGPYVNIAGMEYRAMSGGRLLMQRPVNTESTTDRIQVISGFDRLVEEALR